MPSRIQLLLLARQLRRLPMRTPAVERAIAGCATQLEALSQQVELRRDAARELFENGRELLDLILRYEAELEPQPDLA